MIGQLTAPFSWAGLGEAHSAEYVSERLDGSERGRGEVGLDGLNEACS